MIIRQAQAMDLPAILGLIKLFETESFAEYGIKVKDEYLASFMPRFLATSLVLEANGEVVGAMGGTISECPVNGESIFQQVFWYVKKEHRSHSVELLDEMERFAAGLGLKKIVLCSHGDRRRQTKDRFFRKKGYRVLETHYIKQGGTDA